MSAAGCFRREGPGRASPGTSGEELATQGLGDGPGAEGTARASPCGWHGLCIVFGKKETGEWLEPRWKGTGPGRVSRRARSWILSSRCRHRGRCGPAGGGGAVPRCRGPDTHEAFPSTFSPCVAAPVLDGTSCTQVTLGDLSVPHQLSTGLVGLESSFTGHGHEGQAAGPGGGGGQGRADEYRPGQGTGGREWGRPEGCVLGETP